MTQLQELVLSNTPPTPKKEMDPCYGPIQCANKDVHISQLTAHHTLVELRLSITSFSSIIQFAAHQEIVSLNDSVQVQALRPQHSLRCYAVKIVVFQKKFPPQEVRTARTDFYCRGFLVCKKRKTSFQID